MDGFGLPQRHLEAIAGGDYAKVTDRQRAVATSARQVAAGRKRIAGNHVDAPREVGIDDADVIELTAVVARAAFAITTVDAANISPSHRSPELE